MGYKTKALISERGTLEIKFAIYLKNRRNPYVETGSAQSVNVRENIQATINDCLLNAFYKLQHRRGFPIEAKKSEGLDQVIDKFLEEFQIISYNVTYNVTKVRSFKTVKRNVTVINKKDGSEKIIKKQFVQVKNKDKIIKEEKRQSLTVSIAEEYKDSVIEVRKDSKKRQRIRK